MATSEAVGSDYTYFITDDGKAFYTQTNGTRLIKSEKILEAKDAKDSRPAAADPEGNWGSVTDGLQASVRFGKAAYGANEPITATVIMRNVGHELRIFEMPHGLASDFVVLNPQGKQIERKDWADSQTIEGKIQRASKGPQADSVDPGMQRKIKINLNQFFDFSVQGKYIVSVKLDALTPDRRGLEKIPSGNALVIITNSTTLITNTAPKKLEK